MKDGFIEESDRDILGKIMIKKEVSNGPLTYVFVHGISTNMSDDDKAMYNCRVLNTGEHVFSYHDGLHEPESHDWYEVERSRLRYEIKKSDSRSSFMRDELDELTGTSGVKE